MRLARYFLPAWLLLLTGAAPARAGEISGIVLDADTGQPIQRARVTAKIWTQKRQMYGDVLVVLTGEDGRFWFTDVPQSETEVDAEKAGYSSTAWPPGNHMRPGGNNNLAAPLTIRLVAGGAVTVRLQDDNGFPIAGATVEAIARNEVGRSGVPLPHSGSTGSDGRYRFALVRGAWRIVAQSPGSGTLLRARNQTFVPTYYPGTTIADRAEWVDVGPGKEVQAELHVTIVPAHQVRGQIKVPGVSVQFLVEPAGSNDYSAAWGLVSYRRETGEFRISGLAPGAYDIVAAGFRKTVQITDSDIDNLVITEADRLPGH